jgi:hypothetical protein
METVLNKAERKFVRMSWEVAKAKRSNESINSTSHSHSLPPFFLRKMPKPITYTQTQNVMKKLGQTQKGQKRQKMFGVLVHRKFGRIDLIPRNEKRLFGSSLLFLFYIFAWLCLLYKEKKTHWYKTQTQRDRPMGARAFRLGGARIPPVFERIWACPITITAMVGRAGVRNGTEIAP